MEQKVESVLVRLFKQAGWVALVFFILANLLWLGQQYYLKTRIAQQLSASVRSDLLIGNNMPVFRTLEQNLSENFVSIEYWENRTRTQHLHADADAAEPPIWALPLRIPVCLDRRALSCPSHLEFWFNPLASVPWILLLTALGYLLFALTVFLLQKRIEVYYLQVFKQQNEAAMGRLSARICHDLKLPCLFFQKAFHLDDSTQLKELQPQLQAHLLRLFGMIDKLKRLDLEGLVRPENIVLKESEFHSFLRSIAPAGDRMILTMPGFLELRLDRDKFERAVANLILNGFQAGATLVSVRLQEDGQDLLVLVENDGPEVPSAFKDYFLAPLANATQGHLGLQMVRETVLAHGGFVDLQTGPGRTQFFLKFPDAVLRVHTPDPTPPAAQPLPLPEALPRFAGKQRIWIDADLRAAAIDWLTADEQALVHITSIPGEREDAQLIITRDAALMDLAMRFSIPLVMVGHDRDDQTWLVKLRARIRLLRKLVHVSDP